MTDYSPWEYSNDPISKTQIVCYKGDWILVAVRNSGMTDFYLNFSRTSTIEDTLIEDIDYDEERIFLREKDTGAIYSIH